MAGKAKVTDKTSKASQLPYQKPKQKGRLRMCPPPTKYDKPHQLPSAAGTWPIAQTWKLAISGWQPHLTQWTDKMVEVTERIEQVWLLARLFTPHHLPFVPHKLYHTTSV